MSAVNPSVHWSTEQRAEFWRHYLSQRQGTYDYRSRRYQEVWSELRGLGLTLGWETHLSEGQRCDPAAQIIVDVGAGATEFGRFLWERDFRGFYHPVDGALDGVELDRWVPPAEADYFVAIEILEHLTDPRRLVREMQEKAAVGIVMTTPNPLVTDVLAMDPTHKTPLHPRTVEEWGFVVREVELFGQGGDTLVGTWRGQ